MDFAEHELPIVAAKRRGVGGGDLEIGRRIVEGAHAIESEARAHEGEIALVELYLGAAHARAELLVPRRLNLRVELGNHSRPAVAREIDAPGATRREEIGER